MTSRVLVLLAAAAFAVPATAQITFDNPPPAVPAKATPKPTDKLICEKEETVGSRLSAYKVCLTALQWQQKRQEQRETLEKFQRQQTGVGCQEGQGC